jgi:acyl-CoA thioesterase
MTHTEAEPRSLSLSGAEEMFARDLTCQMLGIQIEEIGPGRASLHMRVTSSMVNGHGIAHGGYLFLLADAAFACASNTHGPIALAQSAQITFLQPAAAGEALVAEAVERTRQGRIGVYDVTVRRAGGPVVAEFRGHSVLLAGRRSLTPLQVETALQVEESTKPVGEPTRPVEESTKPTATPVDGGSDDR